ncbi:hypothetical protein LTS15_004877 [Exophiala xenobiotica]|nr:hypothetical protein LTS15_004877 [Exophiala xenobiotica]
MVVQDPPVCSRCIDQPESVHKLEQHVRISQSASDSIKPPANIVDGACSHISLSHPLSPEPNRIGNAKAGPRLMPPWMASLYPRPPSSNSHTSIRPRRRSTLPTRTTASTLFATPPLYPVARDSAGASLEEPSSVLCAEDGRKSPEGAPSRPSQAMSVTDTNKPFNAEQDTPDVQVQAQPASGTLYTNSEAVSDSQEAAFQEVGEPKLMRSFPGSLIKRNNLVAKRRYSLRRPSAATSINGTGTFRESSKSSTFHESVPWPPQDTAPAKRSMVKDLASFFSNGATRVKSGMPGSGSSSSSANGSRRSSSTKIKTKTDGKQTAVASEKTCERCGADITDLSFVRRESRVAVTWSSGKPDRICQSCKAETTIPGAWT